MLSSKFNVYSTGWLNLVFANRNQNYGAYELRRNYNRRLTIALFLASAFFVLITVSPGIYQHFKRQDDRLDKQPVSNQDEVFKITEYIKHPEKVEKPMAQKGQSKPAKIKTIAFVPPKVVPADEVVQDIPKMEEIDHSVISNVTQDGAGNLQNATSATNSEGDGEGTLTEGGDGGESVVMAGSLEHQPEFPGGFEAFANYLRRNLNYPVTASENGVTGKVFINFIVERDGRLTDIRVVKGIGFGCDEEAIRVLKKSPRWQPGEQNGRKVRVMFSIPIVFSMGG